MKITIADPDVISSKEFFKHALRFTTSWGEMGSSTQVIHLTDADLANLISVAAHRAAQRFEDGHS